jgi:hypothetical protein
MDRFETQVGTQQEPLTTLGDQIAPASREILEDTADKAASALGPVGRLKVHVRRSPALSCAVALTIGYLVGYAATREG